MYDLIGDIHGHATPLKALLAKLGYKEQHGVWQHPHRKVIFLGDFIDRGPEQVEVVRIARCMVEAGAALAVMGNHEFNAVAWATQDVRHPGEYLRPHSEKNRHQHQAFLQQFGEGSPLYLETIEWFKSLPVYLDMPGFRVVHACWHPGSLGILGSFLDEHHCVLADAWQTAARKGEVVFDALEVLLKGMEARLPDGHWFHDKDGNVRHHTRLRWWWKLKGETPVTWHDLAMLSGDAIKAIPHEPAPNDLIPGYHDSKPVFVGHYWMSGEPATLTEQVACLDYSIAAGERGKLVAYRWDGESELCDEHFVWVAGE